MRNLPDGRVKILAEGSDADLERFLKAIRIENTLIKVEDIKAEFSEGLGAYEDFLVAAVREGFKDNGSRRDVQIDEVNEARDDIVSEVKGLRSDLKGRMEERLQRIESDVEEIKARMRP